MVARADAKMVVTGDTRPAQRALDQLGNRVEGMQPGIERTATAASGLSSALGGVGGQAGAVVGAMSNVAAAFSTGGPFLVAVAVATTGLGILTQKWQETAEAAEKATEEQVTSVNKLADEIDKATSNLDQRIAKAGGFDQFAVQIAQQEQALKALNKEYNDLVDQGAFRYAKALGVDVTDATEAWNEQLANLDQLIDDQTFKVETAKAAYEEYSVKLAAAEGLEARRAALLKELGDKLKELTKAQKDASKEINPFARTEDDDAHVQAWTDARLAAIAQIQKDYETVQKNIDAAEDKSFDETVARLEEKRQKALDNLTEIADQEKDVQEQLRDHRRMMEEQKAAFATQTAQIALGATLSAIEGIVAGEEFAVAQAAISVLKQTGTAIVGFGASTVAAGIGKNAIVPGSGVDTIIVGAGLMATGAAMGGVGAVGGGLLSRARGGGGSGGIGSSASGSRDLSTRDEFFLGNSNVAQGRVGGGEVRVYMLGGQIIGEPTDAARATAANLNRARKRLFLDG